MDDGGLRLHGLTLDRISHAFDGRTVVDGVSLSVAPGELVCLLGPSGCGKTTLLRIAAGLEETQGGSVSLGGSVVGGDGAHVPPERRHVGFLFQDFALFPHLSVWDNVAFGLRALGSAERNARVGEVLDLVGMAGHAEHYPHMLSGGQQQRVALARALAPRPHLMLLDEPFSGLDARLRDQVRDETLHVLKRSRVATLMVTHDPEEAMFMADRIALMRDGRIVQVGTPTDLYCRPVDGFVTSFFGPVNRLPGRVRDGRVATPLGVVEADGYGEGAPVDVLVRPEGLRLISVGQEAHPEPTGRVVAARMLGRSSLVHMQVGGAHLHARVPGHYLPAENDRVAIVLDRAQVFVFPAGDEA